MSLYKYYGASYFKLGLMTGSFEISQFYPVHPLFRDEESWILGLFSKKKSGVRFTPKDKFLDTSFFKFKKKCFHPTHVRLRTVAENTVF